MLIYEMSSSISGGIDRPSGECQPWMGLQWLGLLPCYLRPPGDSSLHLYFGKDQCLAASAAESNMGCYLLEILFRGPPEQRC